MLHTKTYIQLFVIFLFLFVFYASSFAEMMSVNGDAVNLRSGPGTNYDVKWEYGKGFPLKVVSKRGDWIQVSDFENDTGWIYRPLLVDKGHMIVKVNKDKNSKIN